MTKPEETLPDVQELYRALETAMTPTQWRTFQGTLSMFLSGHLDKQLSNVTTCSKSTVSRFLNGFADTQTLEVARLRFQVEALRRAHARCRGRKPWLVIRVDLTSVEKTGRSLPFTRTYNGVFGIHLIVLHVSIGKLSFPMGHAIYDPAQEATPIELALKLIQRVHPSCWGDLPQFLVMDSGFYSADALDLLRWWGFEHISFGARSNLRLKDGRQLKEARRGEQVELDTLPSVPLFVSWVELPRKTGMKRFYVLDTKPGNARTLTARHKRRWLIESFFKSAKHEFGLQDTRLRTETGIHNWLFLVWLSMALALYQQVQAGLTTTKRPSWRYTLSEAADRVKMLLMPELVRQQHVAALYRLAELEESCRSYKLRGAA